MIAEPTPRPRATKVLHRLALPLVAVLLALVLAAVPVSAATIVVRMDNSYDFDPVTAQVPRGDTIRWKNFSTFQDHDVRATNPNGYFKSPGGTGGLAPGESYSRTFRSAGRFGYVCLEHAGMGMTGTIVVPMKGSKVNGRFKLTVASQSLPSSSPYRHVLWMDPPGSNGWTKVATTRSATVFRTPGARGTYKFRAQVKRTADGQSSGYSPTVTLSH